MINQRITLLSAAALWLLLATAWVPGVRTDPCSHLEIFDSSGLPLYIPDVCLAQYRTPDCEKFVDTFNIEDLPEPFRKQKKGIKRPDTLNITGTEFAYNKVLYPGLQVCWSSPFDVNSRINLMGFLLIWYPLRSLEKYCQLFLLNSSNPVLNYDHLKFKFDIVKVEDNATLTIKLYSMPPPAIDDKDNENAFQKRTFYSPPAKYIIYMGLEPAKWSPSISFRTFGNGTIDVRFSHPPIYMNLFLYEIVMVRESDPENPIYDQDYKIPTSTSRPPEGVVRLHAPSTDWYVVMIMVKELPSARMVPGECGCWSLDLEDNRHCESICGRSQARINISVDANAIVAALPRTTISMKPITQRNQETTADWDTGLIIIASILGILLITSLVILTGLIIFKTLKGSHN